MSKAISPNTTLAHYTIISQIGAGGIGEVYLARDTFIYLKQGRHAEAITETQKSVELSKRLSATLGVLGLIYAETGKQSEAEALVKELKDRHARGQANGYDLARVYVGLGEKDQAIEWLEKDFQARNATMPNFLSMPPFDSLHEDPRFKDLVRRTGLPELK